MTSLERKLRENPLFTEADIARMLRKAGVTEVLKAPENSIENASETESGPEQVPQTSLF